jgi:hypothetical protein
MGPHRDVSDERKLILIRDWFDRHRHDYDPYDVKLPPKVWAEYFQWLLDRVVLEKQP